MSDTQKVSMLNVIGQRKFIAFLSVLFTSQIINGIVLFLSKGAVVIFAPSFFITIFSIYMGVKELADFYKRKLENGKNGGNE